MAENSYNLLDNSQKKVVDAQTGHHLVLASPGCGKTHILAERVKQARLQGIAYEDMLCLTFTNRAAREMLSRIKSVVAEDFSALQVGNVHHFCAKFLFDEGIVPAETSIIDEEECVSIIAEYKQQSEEAVMNNYAQQREYYEIIHFAHFLQQMEDQQPWEVFVHPECFTEDDREALKHICKVQKMDYKRNTVLEIYHNAENYADEANAFNIDYALKRKLNKLITKMFYAENFNRYKAEHNMLDFEDLLIFTYNIYRNNPDVRHYAWVQVDEVQDLNPLQLAIVDLLVAKDNPMVMYLGDEQQAIFSFMGAKVEILSLLKVRCKGNIHHLLRNHRSPKYLLDVFNDYAADQLKIDRELLPTTDNKTQAAAGDLLIIADENMEAQTQHVASVTHRLLTTHKDETTAIIVNSNADADKVSQALENEQVEHLKISGSDMFNSKDMKLLLAHLMVLANEHNLLAWTEIMRDLKVFDSKALTRRFLYKLRECALSPTDLLCYENSNETAEFLKAFSGDMVVFDTETTGLDVYEDDIIEIAAIRLHNGKPVGEPLDLYIETNRPILEKLGENENPLYPIYHEKLAKGELLQPNEAFQLFWNYVGDATLLGHNVMYDRNILHHNLLRHAQDSMENHANPVFDSLKIMRLLQPNLPSYKLETLLERFQLVGENSHKAIDDVAATISLVALCAEKAAKKQAKQAEFLQHKRVIPFVRKFRDAYKDLYITAKNDYYTLHKDDEKAVVKELKRAYEELKLAGTIKEIDRIDYVLRYLQMDLIVSESVKNVLSEQISTYLLEITTMKESDFCKSRSITERVYVTTVHKAKGLEFDNVIVFDAADGRYPSKMCKKVQEYNEDARKFYVAMSRAKRRLVIAYAMEARDWHGVPYRRDITPFMRSIEKHF